MGGSNHMEWSAFCSGSESHASNSETSFLMENAKSSENEVFLSCVTRKMRDEVKANFNGASKVTNACQPT